MPKTRIETAASTTAAIPPATQNRRAVEGWEPTCEGVSRVRPVRSSSRSPVSSLSTSRAVCNRWSEPFEIAGVTARVDSECLHLEPFPLAGATSFEIPVRDIPAGPYLRDTELGSELARARWNRFRVRVVPD